MSAASLAKMASEGREAIVLRYAEVHLKGQNRGFFLGKLAEGARRALAPIDGATVERLHGRLLAWVPAERAGAALDRLRRVFGVASLSPAIPVAPDERALSEAATEVVRRAVVNGRKPRFAVRVQRSDKSFPVPSPELGRRIGARVVEEFGLTVDLTTPELSIGVEVGRERSFVFGETWPGPGGLPTGTAGDVMLLLSGGIDSPVAGWLAAKRGCRVLATYFHSFPYTGDKTKEKVVGLARILARWQGPSTLFVVHFTEAQKALRAAGPAELAVVLYRRMMLRTAERLARRAGALALVTGDSIGQVASQTLQNLAVVGDAATLPLLRPLVTYDKVEAIELARRIGTFDLSTLPYEDCCSLFVPDHPATRARLADVQRAEERIDVQTLAAGLAERAETIVVEPAA